MFRIRFFRKKTRVQILGLIELQEATIIDSKTTYFGAGENVVHPGGLGARRPPSQGRGQGRGRERSRKEGKGIYLPKN